MACNGESRAMEKHIKLCSRSSDHKVPSMTEYSLNREHFLAPIRRQYAEDMKDYLPEVQQVSGYSPDHGFGSGTLAWTLCCSGYKVACK
eukprot:11239070-Karenia_brevis.AAC.1